MLNFLNQVGVLLSNKPPIPVNYPIIVQPSQVIPVHSKNAGFFIRHTDIKKQINRGELIGKVVNPKNDQTLQEVTASESGFLFTIREHPLVYPGSLLCRIAKDTVT